MLSRLYFTGLIGGMARTATFRTRAIGQHMHMMSTSSESSSSDAPVLFQSNLALRLYTLNRPSKLNSLNQTMLDILRPKIEEWSQSELCGAIVATGVGRAFCAGGDVASVVENAADPSTRHMALEFFKREFEMDYILATMRKPYVAIMDGITMGGGVGLAAPAQFRIATENTVFAMPETKIGYFPDVGASYFMSKLDGELGTYLVLTSEQLRGRAVFEHGFATHYIPSRRIPLLLSRLSSLEDPFQDLIDRALEELSAEREPDESAAPFTGAKRTALDSAFRHDTVEKIMEELTAFCDHSDSEVSSWAKQTLATLQLRSPTSLKVALQAIRLGREMTLLECLQMELELATAFCSGASPDFRTGVTAVLVDKIYDRPAWSPSALSEIPDEKISSDFFSKNSPFLSSTPRFAVPPYLLPAKEPNPMRYSLPTESQIRDLVRGDHAASGNTSITEDELIYRLETLRGGKMGVREKIAEVVKRKCKVVDNSDGNYQWLTWIN